MAGTVYLTVRYGNRKPDFQPGKPTIEIGSGDNLVATLELLGEAVKMGELDEVLMTLLGKVPAASW